jgi:hypothetical protein
VNFSLLDNATAEWAIGALTAWRPYSNQPLNHFRKIEIA